MSAATAAPLSVDDYERVFRVVHGVLLNERGSPSEACLYFGAFGAAILATHHNLAALPVVGAAAYRLGTLASDVLAFAQPTPSSGHASSENAFHCWVQVNGWALDFSAPLFDERLARAGMPRAYGRKMLQKPLREWLRGWGQCTSLAPIGMNRIQTSVPNFSDGCTRSPPISICLKYAWTGIGLCPINCGNSSRLGINMV